MLVVLVALAAYRLTRLWVDDKLPPLPWFRSVVTDWANGRAEHRIWFAREADREDPEHQAEVDRAGKAALRGGYRASRVIGPREQAENARQGRYDGQPLPLFLINCYWCSGFWIGLALLLGCALLPTSVWILPVTALALSATTGLLSNTKH